MNNLDNINLKGQRVILRADLNIPIHNGKIIDFTRINQIIPTIEFLKTKEAKIILVTHFGRPKVYDTKYSVEFLKPTLEKCYKTKVYFTAKLEPNETKILKNTEILLLENIRFHQGEETNDYNFAKRLAAMGDIYLNDAFSCSHRRHASLCAITKFLPAYSGVSLLNEIKNLQKIVEPQLTPKVIVIAGRKVSSKFGVLTKLIEKADYLIIGGAMANTFLKGLGYSLGESYIEESFVDRAREFYNKFHQKLVLPKDLVCLTSNQQIKVYNIDEVPSNANALDIGPRSVDAFADIVSQAKLLIWNGPLGFYENSNFANGTINFAKQVALLTQNKQLYSILGGGDTLAAISKINKKYKFSYVSTSGGAFLEWLENDQLPGLIALEQTN